ncbi:MAG: lysylphosphatidylglycerol synthase transmembrane domain-containing protein [Actinomycetota bacterium]
MISNRVSTWARLSVGAGILAFLAVRMGPAPFVDALGAIGGWSLAAACAIGALTTVCCAWRWSLVAEGMGIRVPLPAAVGAYYRSQFLNATLPGGLLGDVHRGVRHGREVGAVGRSLRAVAWERSLGQVVQLSLTALVLLLWPSAARALHPLALVLAGALAGAAATALVVLRWMRRPRRSPGAVARTLAAVAGDLRAVVRVPGSVPRIALASAVVVGGHAAVFIIAARASGVSVPLDRLLPVTMLVLLASAVPTNIAGWGPREGAAAWAFGAVGLSAAQGLTTAVVFGVLALVATLPGALALVAARAHRPRQPGHRDRPVLLADATHA